MGHLQRWRRHQLRTERRLLVHDPAAAAATILDLDACRHERLVSDSARLLTTSSSISRRWR